MSLSEDRREFCALHGWVGRKAFQHDRHDLCEVPKEDLLPDEEEFADENEDAGVSANEGDVAAVVTDTGEDAARWSRASARRRGIPPKKTVAVRRITQLDLEAGREELRVLGANEPYDRPKTRGDCANVPRPCPYVACSYNLFLDVSETGSIILNFPHLEPGQMPAHQSCALNLAEKGGMTLEEIAVVTNLTRERIRQVELRQLYSDALDRQRSRLASAQMTPQQPARAIMRGLAKIFPRPALMASCRAISRRSC